MRPVAAFAVHPGAFGREVRDNLSRNLPFGAGGVLFDGVSSMVSSMGSFGGYFGKTFGNLLLKTPEQAAATRFVLRLFLFGVRVHRRRVGPVRVLLRGLRRDEVFAAGEGPEAGAGAVGDERAAVRDGVRDARWTRLGGHGCPGWTQLARRGTFRRDVRRHLRVRGRGRGTSGRGVRDDVGAISPPPRGFPCPRPLDPRRRTERGRRGRRETTRTRTISGKEGRASGIDDAILPPSSKPSLRFEDRR